MNLPTIVLALFLAGTLPFAKGLKCYVMADVPQTWIEVMQGCSKTNKPDYSNHPKPNTTMEDYDFDDNCNFQCFFKGVGLLTPEGKPKKDAAEMYFKDADDPAFLKKVNELWNSCIDDSEKIGKEKGFNECKVLALLSFCKSRRIFASKELMERKCC